jgi:hypothetical protein
MPTLGVVGMVYRPQTRRQVSPWGGDRRLCLVYQLLVAIFLLSSPAGRAKLHAPLFLFDQGRHFGRDCLHYLNAVYIPAITIS